MVKMKLSVLNCLVFRVTEDLSCCSPLAAARLRGASLLGAQVQEGPQQVQLGSQAEDQQQPMVA